MNIRRIVEKEPEEGDIIVIHYDYKNRGLTYRFHHIEGDLIYVNGGEDYWESDHILSFGITQKKKDQKLSPWIYMEGNEELAIPGNYYWTKGPDHHILIARAPFTPTWTPTGFKYIRFIPIPVDSPEDVTEKWLAQQNG